jgi:DNA-binding MarR family transcriptional regulator
MSFKFTTYSLDDFEWDGKSELRLAWLMVAIGEWSNDDGVSYHSIADLARRCRVTKEHTIKMIKRLEARGELFVARPEVRGRGRHNTYIMIGNRGPEEIRAVFDKYAVFHRFDAEETVKDIFEKRGSEVGDRLTPETFDVDTELAMLTMWGRITVPPGFDAARLGQIQQGLERSTWRLTEAQIQVACFLVHATNWAIPTSKQKRATWKAGINEHLEEFGGDIARIGRLYGAAYTQMLEYQRRAQEEKRAFEIAPRPQTLTKTMDAINERVRQVEQERTRQMLDGDGAGENVDHLTRLATDPDYAAQFFTKGGK